jgi:hypothetical protein
MNTAFLQKHTSTQPLPIVCGPFLKAGYLGSIKSRLPSSEVSWCRGYHISLTPKRSPVRFRPKSRHWIRHVQQYLNLFFSTFLILFGYFFALKTTLHDSGFSKVGSSIHRLKMKKANFWIQFFRCSVYIWIATVESGLRSERRSPIAVTTQIFQKIPKQKSQKEEIQVLLHMANSMSWFRPESNRRPFRC